MTQARTRFLSRTQSRIKQIKVIEERSVSNFQTTIDAVNRPANEVDVIEPSGTEDDHADNTDEIHEVYIMNPKHEDRASSFFAQPGVLAGKCDRNLFPSNSTRHSTIREYLESRKRRLLVAERFLQSRLLLDSRFD